MALSMDGLKSLLDGIGLRYFADPQRNVLMFSLRGEQIAYQLLLLLEAEGRFLQFRSIGFMHCPAAHPHHAEVMKVLGALNYQLRLVKHAWDARDGEIVTMADLWVMDTTVTPAQFRRMLENYVGGMDDGYVRLTKTLQTGKDPGPTAATAQAPPQRGPGVTEV
jgi:hypothetical protein